LEKIEGPPAFKKAMKYHKSTPAEEGRDVHTSLGMIFDRYPEEFRQSPLPEKKNLQSRKAKSTGRYYFHNVLWIEWEDGIAYRRGLGRVVDDIWKQQHVEEITLILS
jgi:hypothetical protein